MSPEEAVDLLKNRGVAHNIALMHRLTDQRSFSAFLEQALKADPMKAEYYLPTVVSQLLADGKARVKVLRSHDKWYGVTYQEDKPTVVAAIAAMTAQGLYPENLWSTC